MFETLYYIVLFALTGATILCVCSDWLCRWVAGEYRGLYSGAERPASPRRARLISWLEARRLPSWLKQHLVRAAQPGQKRDRYRNKMLARPNTMVAMLTLHWLMADFMILWCLENPLVAFAGYAYLGSSMIWEGVAGFNHYETDLFDAQSRELEAQGRPKWHLF
jgi:hypothetical protein